MSERVAGTPEQTQRPEIDPVSLAVLMHTRGLVRILGYSHVRTGGNDDPLAILLADSSRRDTIGQQLYNGAQLFLGPEVRYEQKDDGSLALSHVRQSTDQTIHLGVWAPGDPESFVLEADMPFRQITEADLLDVQPLDANAVSRPVAHEWDPKLMVD